LLLDGHDILIDVGTFLTTQHVDDGGCNYIAFWERPGHGNA